MAVFDGSMSTATVDVDQAEGADGGVGAVPATVAFSSSSSGVAGFDWPRRVLKSTCSRVAIALKTLRAVGLSELERPWCAGAIRPRACTICSDCRVESYCRRSGGPDRARAGQRLCRFPGRGSPRKRPHSRRSAPRWSCSLPSLRVSPGAAGSLSDFQVMPRFSSPVTVAGDEPHFDVHGRGWADVVDRLRETVLGFAT